MKNEEFNQEFFFNEELWYVNTSPKNPILNIELTGITFADPSYHINRVDNWDMFIIEYISKGKGYIKCNGQKHTVRAGQIYIIKSYTAHEYWADKDNPYEKIWMNVSGSFIRHMMDAFNFLEPVIIRNVDLSSCFYKIKEILENGHDTEAISHVMLEMFFQISESSQFQQQKDIPLADKIRKELDKNINTSISSADVAAIFNVTPVYANRVFKAKYGQTIKQYVNEAALKKAAHWLKNSDFSIGEISDILGYCNDNYFSGLFKRAYGMSPKQYQMKHIQNARCNTPDTNVDLMKK